MVRSPSSDWLPSEARRVEMTDRFVDAERALHAVATLCRLLRVSRSGFYAWLSRSASDREIADGLLAALIHRIDETSDGTYGVPRIHAELCRQGVRVSRRRLSRLMRRLGIRGREPAQEEAEDPRFTKP